MFDYKLLFMYNVLHRIDNILLALQHQFDQLNLNLFFVWKLFNIFNEMLNLDNIVTAIMDPVPEIDSIEFIYHESTMT